MINQENKKTILVTHRVPAERCFGDTISGIRPFGPYTPDMLNNNEIAADLSGNALEALNLGLWVYITESDNHLYFAPEEIDLELPALKQFLKIE